MALPMLWFGIPFLFATFLAAKLPFEANWALCFFFSGSLLLLPFLPRSKRVRAWALLFAVFAGCFNFTLREQWGSPGLPAEGRTVSLSGEVRRVEERGDGSLRYLLRAGGAGCLVYSREDLAVRAGDRMTVQGTVLSMEGTPGFDLAEYYGSLGIDLSVYARRISVEPVENPGIPARLERFRSFLSQTAASRLESPYAGMVQTLLLGEDGKLDPRLELDAQRSGTSHVYVISGLHVSLLCGLFYGLLHRVRLSPRLSALAAGCVLWGFIGLTGFGVSSVRAGVMMTLLLLGKILYRPAHALNSLFCAVVLLLLWNPRTVSSASFQLSFSAVLGLILLAGPIRSALERKLWRLPRLFSGALGIFSASLACNLGMLPVLLKLFGGISLSGLAVNLLVLPLMPVILALSGGLLLPGIGPALAPPLEFLLELLRRISEWGSSPGSYLGLDEPFALPWVLMVYLSALAAALLVKKPRLTYRMLAGGIAGLLALSVFARITGRNDIRVIPALSFEGQSVALIQGSEAVVFSMRDDGYADIQMEALLRSQNVRKIRWYISGSPVKDSSDTRLLGYSIPIEQAVYPAEERFRLYAKESLPVEKVYALRPNHGMELIRGKNGSLLEVYRGSEGLELRLTVRGRVFRFLPDGQEERAAPCTLSVSSGKNPAKLAQSGAETVVLLEKPDGAVPSKHLPAYAGKLRIRIHPDGSWKAE